MTTQGLLEFKTKTSEVEDILNLSQSNIVISWSLNPEAIVRLEEPGAASIDARIEAAVECAAEGCLVGFHFDPILSFPGWEQAYRRLIDRLYGRIARDRIAWISLGTLRYPPKLRNIIERRHPGRRIYCEEMVRGQDGKMRYPRPLRTEMYRKLFEWLDGNDPDVFLYLCMESPAVWSDVFGRTPDSNEDLDYWFARNLFERFPELRMQEPYREYYQPDRSDF
jgi:spore photoproduct lyase